MDRTSWKPKVFKATESVDYKVNEVNIERGGSSMKIDGKNVIKIWESFSGWYWYAIEDQGSYTGIGADGNEVQAHAWYGYVQGMENEWGTWDSNELERAGVWTVPKSNWGWTGKESKASENWKDVADKFYKEELNKDKKSAGEGQHGCPFCGVSFGGSFVGHVRKNHTKEEFTQLQNDGWVPERSVYGEAKLKAGYAQCPHCSTQMNRLDWLQDHIKTSHPTKASEGQLMKIEKNGWEFSVIDNGYGGDYAGGTKDVGLLEVGIFEPEIDPVLGAQKSEIKGWMTQEDVEDLKRTFETDPVMAYRRIGGEWKESWQKGGEAYFVEWGYDLDYDFAEIDDIDDAKQLAKDNGGNVYLDDKLVYSVIPSIKKDPTNDKSKFIVSNNLMGVESKASEDIIDNYADSSDTHVNEDGSLGDLDKQFDESYASENERDEAREWWDYLPYDERESLARDNGGSFDMSKFDYQSEGSKFDITKIFNELILNKQGISGINTVELTRNSGLFDNDYWTEDSGGVKPKGGSYESSEGFNQGLHGYVDAKCKTCGVEFDSIPDMDDHYAMNSDHISNLDDLDNDIPNSD